MAKLNKDAFKFYNSGVEYYNNGNFDQAIQLWKKSIRLDSNYIDPLIGLGNVYNILGKYDKAIEVFKKVIKIYPSSPSIWNELGKIYFKLRQFDNSIEVFQKATQLDSNDAFSYHGLGVAYAKLKYHQKALEAFKKACKIDPNLAHPRVDLGTVYYCLEDYEKAMESYKKATEIDPNFFDSWIGLGRAYSELKDYEKAVESFNSAMDINPNSPQPWHGLGFVYDKTKDYEKAIEAYERAIEIDPNFSHSWINLGTIYTDLCNYEKAIECSKKAIRIDPNEAGAWNNLGNTHSKLNENEKAIEYFKKAIEIDPNFPGPWHGSGMIYYKIKDYQKAIEAYEKATEINPNFYRSWNNLGIVNGNLEHYEKSIECFKKAIQINPNDVSTWSNLGNSYFDLKDYDKSIESYEIGIEIDPNFPYLWNGLGNVYFGLKNYKKAIEFFKKAIGIDLKLAYSWNGLGNAYEKLKDYKKAHESFEKAIEIDSNFPEPWTGLGYIYFVFKDNKRAINCYQKAIEIDPDTPFPWYGLGTLNVSLAKTNGKKSKQSNKNSNNSFHTAFICFAQFEHICKRIELVDKELISFLLEFYSSTDPSLIVYRLLKSINSYEPILKHKQLLEGAHRHCNASLEFLKYCSDTGYADENSAAFNLMRGILFYYLKDPIKAFHLFDEKIDFDYPDNLIAQYYFLLTAYECEYTNAEYKSIKRDVMSKAVRVWKNIKSEDPIQIYYAGQVLYFLQDIEKAFSCFQKTQDLIPSFCMMIMCKKIKKEKYENHLEQLLIFHKHNSLRLYFETPVLEVKNEKDPLEQILEFANVKELEPIIDLLNEHIKIKNNIKSQLKLYIPKTGRHLELSEEAQQEISLLHHQIAKKVCHTLCSQIKDHFADFSRWNSISDNNQLEESIGNFMCVDKALLTSIELYQNLIDYFFLQKKLSYKGKTLLTYWLELNILQQREPGIVTKSTTKVALASAFALTVDLIVGVISPFLFIGSSFFYLAVEEILNEPLSAKIAMKIEDLFINKNEEIPKHYKIFKQKIAG